MVRDWTRVRYTAVGGEETIDFASLAPPIAPDALDVVRLDRNGSGQDPDLLNVAEDSVSYTVPADFLPVTAGEWWDLWYLSENPLTTNPGSATKAAILDAAMDLVRGPEGLSVPASDISDARLQVAAEASYYDLLSRFSAQIPSVEVLGVVDNGAGSDVYHFARAAGFLTAARLSNAATWHAAGEVKKYAADDSAVEYFQSGTGDADTDALLAAAERELGMISLIAITRTVAAAAFPLFGVSGPRRARTASGDAPWNGILRDLLGGV